MKVHCLASRVLATGAIALLSPFGFAQTITSVAVGPASPNAQLVPFSPFTGVATSEAAMMRGDSAATSNGWMVEPLFTVGESLGGYQPPGRLDGIGAFKRVGGRGLVLVNSELNSDSGYAYSLANGTSLRGARISQLVVRRDAASGVVLADITQAGIAYDTVYDRAGQVVVNAAQVNESGNSINGFTRFCSGQTVSPGERGFADEIYFAGEENGAGLGGSEWALDVATRELWALPALGRGAWENVTALEPGDPAKVALLMGSDTAGAPLFLYIGDKDSIGDGSFRDRNGLAVGRLYAWKADSGDLSPQGFSGLNASRAGTWVELTVRDAAKAGQPGYDTLGYANVGTLMAESVSLSGFSFSRPEDVATNPLDGTQAVLSTTGRGDLFPADTWGTIYLVDVDFTALTATLTILHDADGLAIPDSGIRSADNLDWARNGKIYVQEDRATTPPGLFGGVTGIEASLWELDPVSRAIERVAEMDRSAVAPAGATDNCAAELGCWEASGILDVTWIFHTQPGERLLIGTVQAHGIQDGPIGGSSLLEEGGQLFFIAKPGP